MANDQPDARESLLKLRSEIADYRKVPGREERLGGQWTMYVQRDTVLGVIDNALASLQSSPKV